MWLGLCVAVCPCGCGVVWLGLCVAVWVPVEAPSRHLQPPASVSAPGQAVAAGAADTEASPPSSLPSDTVSRGGGEAGWGAGQAATGQVCLLPPPSYQPASGL